MNQAVGLKSEARTRQDYLLDQPEDAPGEKDSLSKNEYKVMRAFLLSSQLTIQVKSRQLTCMIIKQQDKTYFNEAIKKIFDERSAGLEFRDIDRPMKEVIQIESLRLNNHKWDLFKREYGQVVLKERQQMRKGI